MGKVENWNQQFQNKYFSVHLNIFFIFKIK